MNYLRYIFIIIFKILSKIVGVLIFYLLLPFRKYATNRVFNYVLQNNIHLPRLQERKWYLDEVSILYFPLNKSKKVFNLKHKAYIKYKKVSKLEYYFALCIWIWFDADSNYDTHDGIPEDETAIKPFGNTFDLGDLRFDYPIINGMKTLKWIVRNTAYNFNYMFEEIEENSKNNFYINYPKLKWHFGYIPYSNSTRKGRLVFFSEDYNKVDGV